MDIVGWLERRVWPWSELRRLRNWKKEQLEVERGWDEQLVARELDIERGKMIRPQILTKIHGLKSRLHFAEKQVAIRESLHEQQWLAEAARFAGVDFGWIDRQVQDGLLSHNDELQCAKECYRRGMGYREFPEFLRMYQGREGRMCR
jgi:hypothetical protein